MQKLAVRLSVLFVSFFAAALIFPASALAVTFPVAVDETNFPDVTWREYVNTNFADGDYVLDQAEANSVTWIVLNNLGITDLAGIECFTNTADLHCINNALTSLDLTGLTNLETLTCYNNGLSSLEVTGLSNLQYLNCYSNALTSLDSSGLTSLVTLNCNGNLLTSLDVTGCAALQELDCGGNALSSLDFSEIPNLITLYIYGNSFTSLDVTILASLEEFNCSANALVDVTAPQVLILGADTQSRVIQMIPDPLGGFVSEEEFIFDAEHELTGLEPGVTLGLDNRFHMDPYVPVSFFTTILPDPDFTVSGYLIFEVDSYEVSFLDWDATLLGSDIVVYGSRANPPTQEPTRSGYRFTGWDADFSFVTGDTTVTALYEVASPPVATGGLAATSDTVLPLAGISFAALFAGALIVFTRKKLAS